MTNGSIVWGVLLAAWLLPGAFSFLPSASWKARGDREMRNDPDQEPIDAEVEILVQTDTARMEDTWKQMDDHLMQLKAEIHNTSHLLSTQIEQLDDKIDYIYHRLQSETQGDKTSIGGIESKSDLFQTLIDFNYKWNPLGKNLGCFSDRRKGEIDLHLYFWLERQIDLNHYLLNRQIDFNYNLLNDKIAFRTDLLTDKIDLKSKVIEDKVERLEGKISDLAGKSDIMINILRGLV